ncbi:ATP-grasp domain-containing protein [Legionella tunisiensis]|uniref:ATP-grasp domain-containing protein n=1 Tax=Legionella tunisiensis TaxID=1034944 RepID=UPI00031F2AC1|nr:RimK family alpha-L-glutamate ligase [Legionella tunisiensis]
MGLNIDFIEKSDNKSIAEYDALFIRATTSVNHYTYRMARRAAQENLVVIDDPQSIVKCSNKVYLAELMRSHQILTPETLFISKYDKNLPAIEFPCVLKRPDSAFSHGVLKLDDAKSLQKSLNQFFKISDLVLIQPFIPTEYDWRIGILDNKPIFACRYYMAKNHWQIYNWNALSEKREGATETVPLHEVPETVIKTALKSTRLIGDGLYGVDIKSQGDKHYVIEVNDNPNIDCGIEDKILGDSLYEHIMSVFYNVFAGNMVMSDFSLFSVLGIEIEYMLVDRNSLNVQPKSDVILSTLAGKQVNEVVLENGDIAASNELVMHVLELKIMAPSHQTRL